MNGVRAGRVVAFSLPAEDDEEQLVVLAETEVSEEERRAELSRRIRAAVASRVGFQPQRVVLHPRGVLPVTSSGKVRRRAARERFLEGVL